MNAPATHFIRRYACSVPFAQLKRLLDIGFEADAAAGGLVATGKDAGTPIIPDHICRVNFSGIVWRQSGFNHGRPCYEAIERPVSATIPADQATAEEKLGIRALLSQPAVAMGIGVGIGVLAVLAAQRYRS